MQLTESNMKDLDHTIRKYESMCRKYCGRLVFVAPEEQKYSNFNIENLKEVKIRNLHKQTFTVCNSHYIIYYTFLSIFKMSY